MDRLREIRIEEHQQEVAMRLAASTDSPEPWFPSICQCPNEPRCAHLLINPFDVLTILTRHPKNLCATMMGKSVQSWGIKTAGSMVDQWPFSLGVPIDGFPMDNSILPVTTWPLPIGKRALIHDAEYASKYGPPYLKISPSVFDVMPFEGDEYAAIILPVPVGETFVTVFGLARVRDEAGDNRVFEHAGSAYLIRGRDPDAPRVQVLVKNARYYFSRLAGKPLRGSMNAGAPGLSLEERAKRRAQVEEWEEYKRKHSLSWKQVASNKNVPYGRLRKWRQDFGEK